MDDARPTGASAQVGAEQRVVDLLYARLDVLRERAAADLAATRRAKASGTHQNRSERDAFAVLHEHRLSQLWAVEDRLAFGRLDLRDATSLYVGRLGLSDDMQRRLLVDWRAPAARPFYQATAAVPGEVVRRRHLMTRGREVVGVEDDVLDLTGLDHEQRSALQGGGALLAAVTAQRTGRMGDIVATIQAEQDRIIRAEAPGVLVVQGGPGTGKTAVALHRAAYLLYTHRERLARSGVLVVGPGPVFLRYIDQVLPSLGETGVVLSTAGQLFPGVDARASDPPAVAAVKGDPRMADLVAAAVAARQRVPADPVRLDVDGHELVLRPRAVAAARDRARRTGKPHNQARVDFVKDLLLHLAEQMGRSLGTRLDIEERGDVIADLRSSVEVRRALNLAWMPLTPQSLLTSLLTRPDRLAEAGPWLSPEQRALLLRDPEAAWTVEDVPLLDEAAELLGEDVATATAAHRAATEQQRADLEYAQGVLSATGAGGMVSAQTLLERFAETGPDLTVAELAAGDRTWAYGHLVVDEAQELSPMMWRLLTRRCPSRSMTVVGDLAQTRSAAGAKSWAQVLEPVVGQRWRLEQLSVNYRTPAQIMDAATSVLRAGGVDAPAPTSVREGTWPPVTTRVDAVTGATLADVVQTERDLLGGGRVAVVTTAARHQEALAALLRALPAGTVADGPGALDSEVAVLSVAEVKGLEFDGVVLVEPAEVLEGAERGLSDLYVAMTRPTQRLHVLHARDLPAGLTPSPPSAHSPGSRPGWS